jgi:hypothetical protein
MASEFQKFLLAPRVPHIAAGFVDNNFVVVDLRRQRRGFAVAASAVSEFPADFVTPNFDTRNLHDRQALTSLITQTAEAAGLASKRQWAIALPEGAARSFVVLLESRPASRKELDEVVNWKVERVAGVPASELMISRQKLIHNGKDERYLVTVARHEILAEYEDLFHTVGWRAGLMLPRHIGEAQWLLMDKTPGDKMLISANRSGFTAVVTRNHEPVLLRSYVCELESRADDIHRFALYYRERLSSASGTPPHLDCLLVIGKIDITEAQNAVSDALDNRPRLLHPAELGLEIDDAPIWFDQLAGAAGLASLAWQ